MWFWLFHTHGHTRPMQPASLSAGTSVCTYLHVPHVILHVAHTTSAGRADPPRLEAHLCAVLGPRGPLGTGCPVFRGHYPHAGVRDIQATLSCNW